MIIVLYQIFVLGTLQLPHQYWERTAQLHARQCRGQQGCPSGRGIHSAKIQSPGPAASLDDKQIAAGVMVINININIWLLIMTGLSEMQRKIKTKGGIFSRKGKGKSPRCNGGKKYFSWRRVEGKYYWIVLFCISLPPDYLWAGRPGTEEPTRDSSLPLETGLT